MQIRPDGNPAESEPILFVHFMEGDKQVARQPITIGALLELRALNSEMATFLELLKHAPDDEHLVATKMHTREMIRLFYDPDLTTYSVAAHLLSKSLPGSGDLRFVLATGGYLADLALNATPTLFSRIQIQGDLSNTPHRRLRAFKETANRGFLFANLCYGLPSASAAAPSFDEWIPTLLQSVGLPTREKIYETAETFVVRRASRRLADPALRRLREKLREAGLTIIRHRQAERGEISITDWAKLPSPRIMDYNAETFLVGTEVLTEADVDFLTKCKSLTIDITRQALRAGRGMEFQFSDFTY